MAPGRWGWRAPRRHRRADGAAGLTAALLVMLRLGIVGAGFAAELHAQNLRRLRGTSVELTAVCARTREQAEAFGTRHGIARVFTDYREMVESSAVEVVDICATTNAHPAIAVAAARAGKHVIVEKPLTGYFGEASVSRERMLAEALASADEVITAVDRAGVVLCYAEDYVYAPPVAKLRSLLEVGGGVILELRAEESHSGSHATYARHWRTAGGGALLRMGSHPVGAVLHLKRHEGQLQRGRPIRPRSIVAEVAQLTSLPTVQERPRFIRAAPADVEDWSVAIITFDDGTKATIHANDVSLGGVRNSVTAYFTNAVVHANITPNTTVMAYAPDAAVWGSAYITEKVETKAGWQFPSPEEDWMRGYPQEFEDFVEAIRERRPPLAGAALARDVVEVIYAGYLSAATGRRVELGPS